MNYVFRFVLELITVGVNMHNLVIIFVLWSEIRFLYLAAIIIINYDFTIFPMAAMVPNILLLKIFGMISNSMRHALNLFRFLFFFFRKSIILTKNLEILWLCVTAWHLNVINYCERYTATLFGNGICLSLSYIYWIWNEQRKNALKAWRN